MPRRSAPRGTRRASADPAGASAPRPISRFIVMAMLQAARAERMGLSRPSAYSWGLNRAIFFAAAKRGFQSGGHEGGPPEAPSGARPAAPSRAEYRLGDELAYVDPTAPTLAFTIGGDVQTEAEFDQQIVRRFGSAESFRKAWAEAVAVVTEANPADLASGRGFFDRVYRPRRDALRAHWSAMIGAAPPPG